jgi:membrane protease YdiL (CAAX protease family)
MVKQFDRKWVRIGIYYLIALSISYLARFVWNTSDTTGRPQGLWEMYSNLIAALGPFIGAVAIWATFRPERRMRFGGTFPAMGAAMLAVPALVMGSIGIQNQLSVEPHLFGAHLGIWIALYALLEETGWRGYLQDELSDRPALLKYSVVGIFWYGWHFSYLAGHPASAEMMNLLFIVLASIGIGFVADRTRSIFAAASFHIIGNILITTAAFKALIPAQQTKTMIVLICIFIWLVMLRAWRMRDKRIQNA